MSTTLDMAVFQARDKSTSSINRKRERMSGESSRKTGKSGDYNNLSIV